MATYVWIALGSALGGVARYACSLGALRLAGTAFPWGTLFVNVSGSLAIGFLAGVLASDGRFMTSPEARALLMVGFCGGYTTFSSLSFETLNLARAGEWLWAGANVTLSVVLCLVAVWAGHISAAALNR